MKQYGRTINLKDDPQTIERYLEHHRAIWPEVERGLESIGIQRMLIFKLGRQLFMFMETTDAFDPDRDFPRYEASNPRNREWQELMASMQEPVPDARPGEWWAEMKLVFSL
ncbi:MAG TPA: L-rhamnose mutarotase [Candidatus Binatus sp.]|uniref:L-rhamnose mutarotase n=1 Tax=Candidatus Binatus sp. TaxID=2811406 RepID=UPI002B479AFB|nr:L-rhamnose mutarotase [Candidatus Binatus sp.]HKN13289.1 L-rhamnose mutarotase [Candidatus Binatus sp.]